MSINKSASDWCMAQHSNMKTIRAPQYNVQEWPQGIIGMRLPPVLSPQLKWPKPSSENNKRTLGLTFYCGDKQEGVSKT